VQLGNPWNLKGCRQMSGKSLRDYIRRFSRKCNELPKIDDTDVISAFWSGTSCWTLVHDLGRDQTKTTKELLDITTRYVSDKEEVWVPLIKRKSGRFHPGQWKIFEGTKLLDRLAFFSFFKLGFYWKKGWDKKDCLLTSQ
jgi:hypothetical protein